MTNTGRASLFVVTIISLVASASSGCSAKDSGARAVGGTPAASGTTFGTTGGSSGAGTSAGSSAGGSAGAGTTAGTGGSGTAGPPTCMILPVNNPTITQFTPAEAPVPAEGGAGGEGGAGSAPTSAPIPSISFGYDADPPTVASGYSFFYPEANLVSDMSEGAWHVTGSVADYSGFQIAFLCGADAKAYKGISFKISGNAGPSQTLAFVVAHAADTWRNAASSEPSAASCVAVNQYDGTCKEAEATVPVGETEATVELLWADISGGKPEANPDPAEILALRWLFKWDQASAADAAAHQYDVDITLDDLTFIE